MMMIFFGSESIYVVVLAMLFLTVVSAVMLVIVLLIVVMKRQAFCVRGEKCRLYVCRFSWDLKRYPAMMVVCYLVWQLCLQS
ncbi:hypothetical protein Hdeb2414_s0005g00154121 [Helianthus debilis subsp. tardiflorus]